MKKQEDPPADVGVIVARFQVHELHPGHVDLIQSVCDIHEKVIIFLGLSPARVTRNNPLDFEMRKQMIQEKFPKINVLYIKDVKHDDVWSKSLDDQISTLIGPGSSVMLYGSRDSFIQHYTGKYSTQQLVQEQEQFFSGTEVRKTISKKVRDTSEFRAGVIWAAFNQYPKTWPTVDIAVLSEKEDRILLARKPGEKEYRFIGGFADPDKASYEIDARREVTEEAGIEVSEMEYVGSSYVDDWRYRQEVDSIKTSFFVCKYIFGRPEAKDDICELKWFELKEVKPEDLVENHRMLLKMLKVHLIEKRNGKLLPLFENNHNVVVETGDEVVFCDNIDKFLSVIREIGDKKVAVRLAKVS